MRDFKYSAERPEIRDDDVLLTSIKYPQNKRSSLDTLFKDFLAVDKYFEEANYPCTLAIVADGVWMYPTWVEHIKRNMHRYKIELHCLHHHHNNRYTADRLKWELKIARQIIEETFGEPVETYYPPWGKPGEHKEGRRVCAELGLKHYEQRGKIDVKLWLSDPEKYQHVNFHYWHEGQREDVRQALCRITGKNL